MAVGVQVNPALRKRELVAGQKVANGKVFAYTPDDGIFTAI